MKISTHIGYFCTAMAIWTKYNVTASASQTTVAKWVDHVKVVYHATITDSCTYSVCLGGWISLPSPTPWPANPRYET